MADTSTQPNDAVTIPAEIRGFLESLLDDAGMKGMDKDTHERMIKELFVRLDNYLATVIVDHLSDEDIDEFVKMNEEKKPQEEIQKFLAEKLPNAQQVFAQAFAGFRELYLGNVAVGRRAQNTESDTTKDTNA